MPAMSYKPVSYTHLKDYANYFSILSLIAEGKTTQREIDSIINKMCIRDISSSALKEAAAPR